MLIHYLIEVGFLYALASNWGSKFGPLIASLLYGGFEISSVLLSGGEHGWISLAIRIVYVYVFLKLIDRFGGQTFLYWLMLIALIGGTLGIHYFVSL